ncbi:MAG: CDP-diacylglycerol--glycerol-3-phosphate 3-phosphatidyltransferase [Oscillospiraceae bacterium]|nr:CDP-diacylglycerol--glycerol-3-phosphate 3-phosphatidyltransferase [Oscillospiraceae bacterium]
MNLANKLTIFRIVLVPFFVTALMADAIPHNIAIALGIFVIASITDYLDGYIARSRNIITAFGKFFDPIADKILVMAALVCFAGLNWVQSWTVIVILGRDFIVSAIRLAAVESEEKIVIPARMSGKVKTAVTMVVICGIMVLWSVADNYDYAKFFFSEVLINGKGIKSVLCPIANIAMYVCVALNLYSGGQYVWDSRKLFGQLKIDN